MAQKISNFPRKDGERGGKAHLKLFWKLISFGRGRLPWGWESSCCYHWLIWVGWPVRWCLRGCWHCSNISLSVIQSCYRGEGGGGWFWELLFCWWGCLAWSSCRLAGASWYDGAAQQVSNRLCPSLETISYTWSSMKPVQEATPQK